jgi:adaptin ear-binding coat-associated protein 1/2
MELNDPATGQPLPADALQRILFISMKVHVYNIPPLASTKGYTAATWTEDPKRHIFTARVRVIETAVPLPSGEDRVKVDVVLEDPSTGQLFAAAPYTAADIVEPALDSSRFFTIRVQDPSGRKAILGIGFEERPESFDFGVALQEARKTVGIDQASNPGGKPGVAEKKVEEKRDYSLKEGETITVSFGGGKFGRRRTQEPSAPESANLSSFSLPPPPSASASRGGGGFSLPPPPGAAQTPAGKSTSESRTKKTAAELGFDDGQFGEFA